MIQLILVSKRNTFAVRPTIFVENAGALVERRAARDSIIVLERPTKPHNRKKGQGRMSDSQVALDSIFEWSLMLSFGAMEKGAKIIRAELMRYI